MTRASLLRILDHVNGISDGEIRELEQLAAAFPYCQTAHVLLAKAAHDSGSMLAGQRLRRAATYATDRELLRQLLMRPAPATPTDTVPADVTLATAAGEALGTDALPVAVAPTAEAASVLASATPMAVSEASESSTSETDLFAVEAVLVPAFAEAALPATDDEPTATQAAPEAPATTVAAASEAAAVATDDPTTALEPAGKASKPEPGADELPATEAPAADVQTTTVKAITESEAASAATSVATVDAAAPSDEAAAETAAVVAAQGTAEQVAPETPDEVLPAVAPPIRPPGGAGISRFEFGLGESRLPEPSGYRLPGISEEEEEFDLEEDELPAFRALEPPHITAPFRADAELGYALSGGSRLGYDLQARTPDGSTLDLPLEAFFEPDALLLAHARAHQPAPKASSLDLINRFLKAQPRIRAGAAGIPLPATEQADLSVRSAAAAPALASESLAKIMVRQGKTAKAIEIYERLMTKQPEKMAYFAEQIQQLQQAPE